ncbi:MAG: DEAD/DEAH box helicase, partial [Burkholderiales bacterium]|nr:DEAD/DEAH box helicase [Burkholderiales bacterium]
MCPAPRSARKRVSAPSAAPAEKPRSGRAAAAGDALAAKLARLGIRRDLDRVLHLPLRYEDETRVTPIAAAATGVPVQIEGRLVSVEIALRPRRHLIARVADASGEAVLRFLNFYGSQHKALQAALSQGLRVRAFGEIRPGFFGGEMIHPRYRVLRGEVPLPRALTPVYPVTAGLSQAVVRQLIEQALARAALEDTLPQPPLESLRLPAFREAVLALHHLDPEADVVALADRSHPAWRRMKFDELLAQQLSMRRHYRERRARAAAPLRGPGALEGSLLAALPFRLTGAQERAWREIGADLAQPHPMHRLLQGDVGSGKTIVSALAALRAAHSGFPPAVMAPTEILAEQHLRKFTEWLAPLGVTIAWLSGSQAKAERAAALRDIAAGAAQVAIGTHALFQ